MLIIIFGNIGTGKSSLAKELAKSLGFELVYFDNVMWLCLKKDKMYGDNDEFLLSSEETQRVYDEMHLMARSLLVQGKDVILESMYFKKQRDEAKKLAKDMKTDYKLVEVVADEGIIRQRLEKRKKQDSQTPGFRLYQKYKDYLESEDETHIIIDTSKRSVSECVEELVSSYR